MLFPFFFLIVYVYYRYRGGSNFCRPALVAAAKTFAAGAVGASASSAEQVAPALRNCAPRISCAKPTDFQLRRCRSIFRHGAAKLCSLAYYRLHCKGRSTSLVPRAEAASEMERLLLDLRAAAAVVTAVKVALLAVTAVFSDTLQLRSRRRRVPQRGRSGGAFRVFQPIGHHRAFVGGERRRNLCAV